MGRHRSRSRNPRRHTSVLGTLLIALLAGPLSSDRLESNEPAVGVEQAPQCGTGLVRSAPDGRAPVRAATLARAGDVLRFTQEPPLVFLDQPGSVSLANLLVAGDQATLRVYYSVEIGVWAFEEFGRIGTRTVDGQLLSVFAPSWSLDTLIPRFTSVAVGPEGSQAWGLYVGLPDTTPSGRLPLSARPAPIQLGSSGVLPVAVKCIDDVTQYSSHVANLLVPGFDDELVSRNSFDLDPVARGFLSHFEDVYDALVILPASRHVATYTAYYDVLQNEIGGIGLPIQNAAPARTGSQRLHGLSVFVSGLNHGLLAHELGHQWGDYIDWTVVAGTNVRDRGHTPLWGAYESPLSNRIHASLRLRPSGRNWVSEAAPRPHRYPPLLRYAMGLLPREDVPPLDVLLNQRYDFVAVEETALTSGARTVPIDDIVARYGPRTGPVPDRWRVGFVVVSPERLLSPREMAYWTFLVRRLEDPAGSGVVDSGGQASFDSTTGLDLQSDIVPREGKPVPAPQWDDAFGFGEADVRGLKMDAPIPSRYDVGETTMLRGRVTPWLDEATEVAVSIVENRYRTAPVVPIATVRSPVSRDGRFALPLRFDPEQRGVYVLTFSAQVGDGTVTLGDLRPVTVR